MGNVGSVGWFACPVTVERNGDPPWRLLALACSLARFVEQFKWTDQKETFVAFTKFLSSRGVCKRPYVDLGCGIFLGTRYKLKLVVNLHLSGAAAALRPVLTMQADPGLQKAVKVRIRTQA